MDFSRIVQHPEPDKCIVRTVSSLVTKVYTARPPGTTKKTAVYQGKLEQENLTAQELFHLAKKTKIEALLANGKESEAVLCSLSQFEALSTFYRVPVPSLNGEEAKPKTPTYYTVSNV